jgi:hypothetical protein
MKLTPASTPFRARRRADGAVATLMMFALVVLLAALVTASHSSVRQLRQEIQLIERRQTQRLLAVTVTNVSSRQSPDTNRAVRAGP